MLRPAQCAKEGVWWALIGVGTGPYRFRNVFLERHFEIHLENLRDHGVEHRDHVERRAHLQMLDRILTERDDHTLRCINNIDERVKHNMLDFELEREHKLGEGSHELGAHKGEEIGLIERLQKRICVHSSL